MPEGYHPNVSIPGHPISFIWIMAAHREVEDRQFGVVNVQPELPASPRASRRVGRNAWPVSSTASVSTVAPRS